MIHQHTSGPHKPNIHTFTMHDGHAVLATPKVVPHTCHHVGDQRERRGVMIWKRSVEDAVVEVYIFVTSALSSELPYHPVVAVFALQEGEDTIVRVTVCFLGEGGGRHGHGDYGGGEGHIAEV